MSKLTVILVLVLFFGVGTVLFSIFLMPLSKEDVAKCDEMGERFEHEIIRSGIKGYDFRYCIPNGSFIGNHKPTIVVGTEIKSKDHRELCGIIKQLQVSSISIVKGDVKETVRKKADSSMQRTDYEHPDIVAKISLSDCKGYLGQTKN
jgi:hypothetical protein